MFKLSRIAVGAAFCASLAAQAATIGLMAPLSGPQALVGQDQVDGFMLALEQLGGKLGGQPATVLKEDDQLKPEVGQQIVRKFNDKDKVDAIVGLSFSNVLMGSLPRLAESGRRSSRSPVPSARPTSSRWRGRTTVRPRRWASSRRTAASSAST